MFFEQGGLSDWHCSWIVFIVVQMATCEVERFFSGETYSKIAKIVVVV